MWRSCGWIAANLQEHGIARGDVLAISGIPLRQRLPLILALARLGAVSTGVEASMPLAQRDELFRHNGAVAWVTAELPAEQGNAPRSIDPGEVFRPGTEGSRIPPLASGLEGQVWRIALSSGTTGVSKCIALTHRQAALQQRLSLDVYPNGPRERLLVLADMNIGFALGHSMHQLAAGGALILPRSIDAADMYESLSDAPTRIVTTPAIANALVRHARAQPQPPRVDGLLSILLFGAAVPPALRAELETLFCPNIGVVYGSTEIGSTARADLNSTLEAPQSAGRLLPWIEGQAVDEAGLPLPAGQPGRLRFRSPTMATEYLGSPEATAQAFRGGWFYSGDTGSVDGARNLTLGGRSNDVLNLDGVKTDPARIEAALNEYPGIAESAVTAIRRRDDGMLLAMLVVPADPAAKIDDEALMAYIVGRLGRQHSHQRVFAASELPRTPAGKLDRTQLPALAEALRERAQPPAAH